VVSFGDLMVSKQRRHGELVCRAWKGIDAVSAVQRSGCGVRNERSLILRLGGELSRVGAMAVLVCFWWRERH